MAQSDIVVGRRNLAHGVGVERCRLARADLLYPAASLSVRISCPRHWPEMPAQPGPGRYYLSYLWWLRWPRPHIRAPARSGVDATAVIALRGTGRTTDELAQATDGVDGIVVVVA